MCYAEIGCHKILKKTLTSVLKLNDCGTLSDFYLFTNSIFVLSKLKGDTMTKEFI